MTNELDDALRLADRLLDEPNADPDDDLRVLARHLRRQFESHERYKQALQRANGYLILHGQEPVKLEYAPEPRAVPCACPEGMCAKQGASYIVDLDKPFQCRAEKSGAALKPIEFGNAPPDSDFDTGPMNAAADQRSRSE